MRRVALPKTKLLDVTTYYHKEPYFCLYRLEFDIIFSCIRFRITAFVCVDGQVFATFERPTIDIRYAGGNYDSLQASATTKRTNTNTRNAVRNHNALQVCATVERSLADTRHAVGDRDALQACATRERIPSDACDTLGNHDVATVAYIFFKNSIFNQKICLLTS